MLRLHQKKSLCTLDATVSNSKRFQRTIVYEVVTKSLGSEVFELFENMFAIEVKTGKINPLKLFFKNMFIQGEGK